MFSFLIPFSPFPYSLSSSFVLLVLPFQSPFSFPFSLSPLLSPLAFLLFPFPISPFNCYKLHHFSFTILLSLHFTFLLFPFL